MRPDTTISVVRESRRLRRSTRLVAEAIRRLVRTAKMPEIEIAWPAWPSVTSRSDAMGVRRLTGMNSEAMSVDTHRVSAKTAPRRPSALTALRFQRQLGLAYRLGVW